MSKLSFEERDRRARGIYTFLRSGPHEPMATPAEVLEVPCAGCGAPPGEQCRTAFPHTAWAAGMTLRGFAGSGIHLRRYLDRTGDPR